MSGGKGSEPTTEPLTFEELQLAGRNRGMPLEALRYDITPTGLHYLLIHFDIPAIDRPLGGCAFRRRGTRAEPQFRGHPGAAAADGAGDPGMRRQRPRPATPRPLSQPWLVEAIGTARWTGTPVRDVLDRAGLADDAVELVFTGADRGIQGEVEHDYQRSLTLDEALREDVLLATR